MMHVSRVHISTEKRKSWANAIIKCKRCGAAAAMVIGVPAIGWIPTASRPIGELSWFRGTDFWWAISFQEARSLKVAPQCALRDVLCPGHETHDLGSPITDQILPFCLGVGDSHDIMGGSMVIEGESIVEAGKSVTVSMAVPSTDSWPVSESSEGYELFTEDLS